MKFDEQSYRRRSHFKRIALIGLGLIILLLVIGIVLIRKSYSDNLKPVSTQATSHVITIDPGSTTAVVADTLHAKGAIKSDWAFEWYVRNHELRDELKAGTYVVYANQSVSEIVATLVEGKVATDLVTIVPGQRLDQIKASMIKDGFEEAAVDAALEPTQWASHPALTDKPAAANLEGYLYPESFQKTGETTPKQVIQLSLDEMETRLTPDVRQAISKQGMTLHQAVTLASIIEREVTTPEDRAQVAQVFKKRLAIGMKLQSNATDDYAKIDQAYNTYKIDGLPPGPISNFSESAIQAVAFPAQTDWTYFVSGDDKKTYFSKTNQEHDELVKKHCSAACGN